MTLLLSLIIVELGLLCYNSVCRGYQVLFFKGHVQLYIHNSPTTFFYLLIFLICIYVCVIVRQDPAPASLRVKGRMPAMMVMMMKTTVQEVRR